MPLRSINVRQLVELLLCRGGQPARRRVLFFRLAPSRNRIAAVKLARQRPELILRRLELPQRDVEKAIGIHCQPLIEREFPLEEVTPQSERRARLGCRVLLEVLDIARNRAGGFGRGVCEVAEQVHVVESRKRPRQVLLDEVERTAERLEADFDENARRILDVVAGRLHDPGGLTQLRQHAAGTLGERRMRKNDLRREARAQRVCVVLRVALPGADLFELEHARLNVRRHHRLLSLFDGCQIAEVDVLEPPREARKCARVLVDGVTAEVFDVVVVRMYAVKRRARGVNFVKVGEIVVDEMMKRLGRTHHLGSSSNPSSVIPNSDKPQWYIILIREWRAACTSSPRRLETSTT